jgi:hypothetical protein
VRQLRLHVGVRRESQFLLEERTTIAMIGSDKEQLRLIRFSR